MLSWILEAILLQNVKKCDMENEAKKNADVAVPKRIKLEPEPY